jgi:hypothetical protein
LVVRQSTPPTSRGFRRSRSTSHGFHGYEPQIDAGRTLGTAGEASRQLGQVERRRERNRTPVPSHAGASPVRASRLRRDRACVTQILTTLELTDLRSSACICGSKRTKGISNPFNPRDPWSIVIREISGPDPATCVRRWPRSGTGRSGSQPGRSESRRPRPPAVTAHAAADPVSARGASGR